MKPREALAIQGGRPVRSRRLPFEFPGGNWYDGHEAAAVERVVRAGRPFRYYGPTPPKEVDRLEQEFARFVGVRHALGVNSGTQALAVAMSALGVGPGAEVIVPAYMWVSIVASVVRLGAIPVIAEVDDSFTLDPADLPRRITKRTRLIVAVHMSGAPADMAAILAAARPRGIPVLEDCAQANGASFRGRRVGSMGDMGIFSLQLNKNMTTGEGGMVVTRSTRLFRRAFAIHDLGYPRVNGRLVQSPEYSLWGFGARMSELAGAVGRVQLRKLPRIVCAMRDAKRRIRDGLADVPGLAFRRLNDEAGDTGAFLIMLLPDKARAKRFAAAMDAEGISSGLSPTVTVADFGMHVYSNIPSLVNKTSNSPDGFPWTLAANRGSDHDYRRGSLPRSDALFERSVIMPVPSVMTRRDISDTIRGIRKVAAAVL
jgi:8-amino-3,8-dideoxy-alpha-D-manno-octulosonate transaminase